MKRTLLCLQKVNLIEGFKFKSSGGCMKNVRPETSRISKEKGNMSRRNLMSFKQTALIKILQTRVGTKIN